MALPRVAGRGRDRDLDRLAEQPDWPRTALGLAILAVIFGFAMWKLAVVREHVTFVFATAVVAMFPFATGVDRRTWLVSTLAVGIAFAGSSAMEPKTYLDVVGSTRSIVNEVRHSFQPDRIERAAEATRNRLRDWYELDFGHPCRDRGRDRPRRPGHGLGSLCLPGTELEALADLPVIHGLHVGPRRAQRRPPPVGRRSPADPAQRTAREPLPIGWASGSIGHSSMANSSRCRSMAGSAGSNRRLRCSRPSAAMTRSR